MAHPLALVLDDAVHGRFPEPDGRVEVVGAPPDGPAALLSFTARAVVAVDVDAAEVARRCVPGDLSTPTSAEFLQWVAHESGTKPATFDALFATLAIGGDPTPLLERVEMVDMLDHPRVARASRYRTDLRVYTTTDGDAVVVLGRGVTRRWEVAFEVDDAAGGRGVGRSLAAAARSLLPEGTPIWAQVAPGNARSMRAVIAAGYRPIGAEILFVQP